ncbi:MAG: heme o synthase [Anaerolineales bacterium]
MRNKTENLDKIKVTLRTLLIFSAVTIFLGIVFGGMNKQLDTKNLEITHQIFVGIGGILLFIALVYGIKNLRAYQAILKTMKTATILMIVQILLGQFLRQSQDENWFVGIHYLFSVIILGLVLSSIIYLLYTGSRNNSEIPLKFSSSFSKHAVLGVSLGFLALFSGIFISISGIRTSCLGWPLCGGSVIPQNLNSWIIYIHRIVVLLVGIYLVWFNRQAWRKQRSQSVILTVSNLFVVVYFAQGFVGAIKTIRDFPIYMLVLHESTAVVLIGLGFILLTAIGIVNRSEEEETTEASIKFDYKQRFKDILALNKPVVVLLLLSTTIAGMIIGAGGFPKLEIFVFTTIGGLFAAGGSSAINQYIDRNLDGLMTRTSKRPIPSGRLMPAEGLAYGMTSLVISFYILAGFVNILAALLSLAGMLYYVVFYSLVLKKKSVQNIVIGGGAGAIPPLVGWAASTGTLTIEAAFLFLIIFLWTPPHFWALALLRKNEYAAANVPMMPVIRGEEPTKKLIFQYSIILVFTTLLMWIFGLAGWIYLGGAFFLGIYLIYLAAKVFFDGRNRVYYKMYRHSNYYLLFLFIIMAIDSVYG